MPKSKKRGKGGNRNEKEKPLLTVQGVLKLDKSFITAQHEDAEVLTVQKDPEREAVETIKLIPGESEHDLVDYKAGYDVGPANPFPQNEPEKVIFEAQKAVDAKQEAFERLKVQVEAERQQKQQELQDQGLITKPSSTPPPPPPDPHNTNPDDPDNYYLPEAPAYNDLPLEFGHKATLVLPPGEEEDALCDMVRSKREEASKMVPFEMKPLPEDAEFGKTMALDVALKMEEVRRLNRAEAEPRKEEELDADVVYSLDEMERLKEGREAAKYGPEISKTQLQRATEEKADFDAQKVLKQHWSFVKSNPQDFNGWTYLLQHVESTDDTLDDVRAAYNAFLPLFPYCYAYWIRYSEIEKKHGHWQRSLAILHRSLEALPLSTDLWLAYLDLYQTMYQKNEDFESLFAAQCERAILAVGLDFKSDAVWERCLEWQLSRNNLRDATEIYRRLVGVPTQLYNKHWDNFIAFVRDHHPRDILPYPEYEGLRKLTCQELGLTYRPDPVVAPERRREVVQPEDKLKAGMKERIVASVVAAHEKCEESVDRRLRFEDKIKRSYFHVKPVDLKQLRNWEAYLDFEIAEGRP